MADQFKSPLDQANNLEKQYDVYLKAGDKKPAGSFGNDKEAHGFITNNGGAGEIRVKVTKPTTVRANQIKDKFFGVPAGSEEADDVLFALQAFYGDPKLDYEEATNRFTEDEVKKAVDYVTAKGYNKFTYFDGYPYGKDEDDIADMAWYEKAKRK